MKLLQQFSNEEDMSKQDLKIRQDDHIYRNKLSDWMKQKTSKISNKHIDTAALKSRTQLMDELNKEAPYAWANQISENQHSGYLTMEDSQPVDSNNKQADLGPSHAALNSSLFYEKLAEPEKIRRVKKNLFGSSPSTSSPGAKSKENQLTSNRLVKESYGESIDASVGNSPIFAVEAEKKKSLNLNVAGVNEFLQSSEAAPR